MWGAVAMVAASVASRMMSSGSDSSGGGGDSTSGWMDALFKAAGTLFEDDNKGQQFRPEKPQVNMNPLAKGSEAEKVGLPKQTSYDEVARQWRIRMGTFSGMKQMGSED